MHVAFHQMLMWIFVFQWHAWFPPPLPPLFMYLFTHWRWLKARNTVAFYRMTSSHQVADDSVQDSLSWGLPTLCGFQVVHVSLSTVMESTIEPGWWSSSVQNLSRSWYNTSILALMTLYLPASMDLIILLAHFLWKIWENVQTYYRPSVGKLYGH